jgi:hypothetical protein
MVWIALILLLGLCLFIALYWLALKQFNHVTNFLLLVLLSEENYRLHRDGVVFLASTTKADNAVELAFKVQLMVRKLISDGDGNKLFLSVSSLLWNLKKSTQPGAANSPSTGG